MNKITGAAISALTILVFSLPVFAQSLQLPDAGTNYKSKISRQLAATEIEITWNAPGVKGREGKIWGTDVAYYGYEVLGFGSYMKSPWRAGADESTTISFSTDVLINGKRLPAGKYGFFIAVYPDSCVLIFNKNTKGWGSYFYNSSLDVLHVTTRQEKDLPQSKERLEYNFSKQTANTIVISLDWEKWRIPFTVETDVVKTGLASIQTQMSGALGFDPPSLEAAAAWCLRNDINYEQALVWITSATDPNLGGVKTFNALSTRSGLLKKMGRNTEADSVMQAGISIATAVELHSYGRRLISENKAKEALAIFELNHKRNKGGWPTEAGLMRGYSATGDLKKALEHAKTALTQAPNPESKRALEDAIKKLTEGKAL
jgi:tetratricopeptide (TPR) repeat protein